jgi:hypothetical protein
MVNILPHRQSYHWAEYTLAMSAGQDSITADDRLVEDGLSPSPAGSSLGSVFRPLSRWGRVRVREGWSERRSPLIPALSRWEREK